MAHLRKIIRSSVQYVIFKYAPENIVVTNTAYKSCNDGAPTAGIQRKSGNSQLTNVLNSLKLAGILDLTTIGEIADARNSGNKQAECVAALAELIKNEMESGHKVSLGDLWATLQRAPYGYYNTIACGFSLALYSHAIRTANTHGQTLFNLPMFSQKQPSVKWCLPCAAGK